jgi:hypothetical protein
MRNDRLLALVSLTLLACGNGAGAGATAAQNRASIAQSTPDAQNESDGSDDAGAPEGGRR